MNYSLKEQIGKLLNYGGLGLTVTTIPLIAKEPSLTKGLILGSSLVIGYLGNQIYESGKKEEEKYNTAEMIRNREVIKEDVEDLLNQYKPKFIIWFNEHKKEKEEGDVVITKDVKIRFKPSQKKITYYQLEPLLNDKYSYSKVKYINTKEPEEIWKYFSNYVHDICTVNPKRFSEIEVSLSDLEEYSEDYLKDNEKSDPYITNKPKSNPEIDQLCSDMMAEFTDPNYQRPKPKLKPTFDSSNLDDDISNPDLERMVSGPTVMALTSDGINNIKNNTPKPKVPQKAKKGHTETLLPFTNSNK